MDPQEMTPTLPERREGMRHRRTVGVLIVAVAVVGAILGVQMLAFHLATDPLTDFRVYYDAAARLNAGLPLYPPGARIYPPLFEIVLRPLALLPFDVAAGIWVGITLAAFGLTLWRLGIRRPATWIAVGSLSAAIAWVLAIGQAEVIITLLLALGNPLAVALAGNIKLFPLLAGIYWLARRDWRDFGRFVGWTGGLALLQLVLDPGDTLAFPGTLAVVSTQVAQAGNHDLSPFAYSPLVWAVLVAVGVALTWRLGRTRWGWAAAVALSVLASPHLFSYNLMTLLACLRRQDAKSRGPERGISTWPDKSATQEQA
jgi:hypothetical protein